MTEQNIRYNFNNGRIVMYWTPVSSDIVIASTTLPVKECIRYSKIGYTQYIKGNRQQYRPVYDMYKKFGKSKVRIRILRYAPSSSEYELKTILKNTKLQYANYLL